jgi:hypothetical protein
MAILLIGEKEKADIARAIERARRRPLPIEIGRQMALPDRPVVKLADRRPGAPSRERHRPEQVLIPYGYRAMLSFEEQPSGIFMHLSVSVERDDPKWNPSVPAFQMIAEAFGIDPKGANVGSIWLEEYEPGRHAVNILALITPKEGPQ